MNKPKTISHIIPCRRCLILPMCIFMYEVDIPYVSIRKLDSKCCFIKSFIRSYKESENGVTSYIDSHKIEVLRKYYDDLKGKEDENSV